MISNFLKMGFGIFTISQLVEKFLPQFYIFQTALFITSLIIIFIGFLQLRKNKKNIHINKINKERQINNN